MSRSFIVEQADAPAGGRDRRDARGDVRPTRLGRRQLFEFGDQPWLTGRLRASYIECLSQVIRTCGFYRKAHVHLASWAKKSGAQTVLDLGSGSGTPIDIILREAARRGRVLPKIVLSDRYPLHASYDALEAAHGTDRIGYVPHSLDARDAQTTGIEHWMMCSAFHHLDPSEAERLLSQSLESARGIFIIEPYSRSIRDIALTLCFGVILGMVSPFTGKRFTWTQFLLCTVFPIVPLMVAADGVVSVLRTYRPEEIAALLPRDSSLEVEFGAIDYRSPHRAYFFSAFRK